MAKPSSNRSGGNHGSKSRNQAGSKGKGPGGLPSRNPGKPSGGGRTNAPPKRKGK